MNAENQNHRYKLSVVIPCFNEGEILESVLEEFIETFNKRMQSNSYQLIIVDDGSKDNSADIIRSVAKNHQHIVSTRKSKNGGMWSAIHKGLGFVEGEFATFLPADGEFSAKETLRMLGKIQNADIVVSSRKALNQDLDTQKKVRPWFREFISATQRGLVRVLLNFDIRGTEGLFLFKWNSFKYICLKERQDNILYLELLSLGLSGKLICKRMTTYYTLRRAGKSKALGIRNIVRTTLQLLYLSIIVKCQ